MVGINWKSIAEKFILEWTEQRTVLKAMNYLNGLVYGDDKFVELVADAMKTSYEDAVKKIAGIKKVSKKDESPTE